MFSCVSRAHFNIGWPVALRRPRLRSSSRRTAFNIHGRRGDPFESKRMSFARHRRHRIRLQSHRRPLVRARFDHCHCEFKLYIRRKVSGAVSNNQCDWIISDRHTLFAPETTDFLIRSNSRVLFIALPRSTSTEVLCLDFLPLYHGSAIAMNRRSACAPEEAELIQ
jgi:hypothetical protein